VYRRSSTLLLGVVVEVVVERVAVAERVGFALEQD
jgi:hypothetical protein